MAPIRVALVGLSANATTSWAAQGHLPYLLSLRGKTHYEVVALLNSSTKAAEAAREHFKLSSSVKTYGDPAALAADPDVDLVVVSTRVDTHAALARPQLEAGKPVFVEWPVASSAAASRALLDPGTNEKHKAALQRSIVGLQGQAAPILTKLREVLDSGRIGKVVNSEAKLYANLLGRDSQPEPLAYLTERKVGGSSLTITYGHTID
ncbi:NAD(P)-binding protein, partial [Cryphonectria parasitica EP155]